MGLTIAQALLLEGEQLGEKRGELKIARQLLLRVGTKRLGAPSQELALKIEAHENGELLSDLVVNLLDFPDWQAIEAKL